MLFIDGATMNPASASDTPIRTPPIKAPGIEPRPLPGHPAAWNYVEPIKTPANDKFIKEWQAFPKNPKRVTNDPMEATYIGFNMWVKPVEKAKSIEADKVIDAGGKYEHEETADGTTRDSVSINADVDAAGNTFHGDGEYPDTERDDGSETPTFGLHANATGDDLQAGPGPEHAHAGDRPRRPCGGRWCGSAGIHPRSRWPKPRRAGPILRRHAPAGGRRWRTTRTPAGGLPCSCAGSRPRGPDPTRAGRSASTPPAAHPSAHRGGAGAFSRLVQVGAQRGQVRSRCAARGGAGRVVFGRIFIPS